ncbi:hypothetical protein F5051DRAFT_412736 [Lentinula edodes]|nr:hypothetical protein F5051DRAFT_412736 [Lentinula edodes]
MIHHYFPFLFLLLFISLLLRFRSSPLRLIRSSSRPQEVPWYPKYDVGGRIRRRNGRHQLALSCIQCSFFHIAEEMHFILTGRLLDQLPQIKTSSVVTST